LTLLEAVPQGHKVALRDLAKGDEVIRYNVTIGFAAKDLPAGSWLAEHNVEMPAARELMACRLPPSSRRRWNRWKATPSRATAIRTAASARATSWRLPPPCSAYRAWWILRCSASRRAAAEVSQRRRRGGLEHTYGCGVAIDAPGANIPIRTIRNIALNPNFGGQAMVVSLGCEKLQPTRLFPKGSIPIQNAGGADPGLVCLQDAQHVGFMSMIDSIMKQAEINLAELNKRQRETVPASELVVGVQCGGSDAFSGVTANPAVGFATDLLVRAGATVMFSEVTEVRDGIDQLTSRATTPEVAEAMIREMDWYDNYLKRGGVDRSANTTPGNKKGGLSNIVEKAMGSIVKSGSAPISGVLSPGDKLTQKGLIYAATPASDFICGTLQLAAGMNLHIFTTGRGTPYGLAEVPVIKVATRNDLANRWHDLMDINAGRIASGEATIAEVGWEMFQLMLDVASGRETWAEKWKLHNALVLFNPAPVT
jgi:galactarate dehydratase